MKWNVRFHVDGLTADPRKDHPEAKTFASKDGKFSYLVFGVPEHALMFDTRYELSSFLNGYLLALSNPVLPVEK